MRLAAFCEGSPLPTGHGSILLQNPKSSALLALLVDSPGEGTLLDQRLQLPLIF